MLSKASEDPRDNLLAPRVARHLHLRPPGAYLDAKPFFEVPQVLIPRPKQGFQVPLAEGQLLHLSFILQPLTGPIALLLAPHGGRDRNAEFRRCGSRVVGQTSAVGVRLHPRMADCIKNLV